MSDQATDYTETMADHIPDHAPATVGELRELATRWEADRQDIITRLVSIDDMLTELTPYLPKIAAMADIFEQMGAMMGTAQENGVKLLGVPQ